MTNMDAFRQAVAEIGLAPAESLSAYIEEQFRVTIDPKYFPLFRATLADWENWNQRRQTAKPVAETSPEI